MMFRGKERHGFLVEPLTAIMVERSHNSATKSDPASHRVQ